MKKISLLFGFILLIVCFAVPVSAIPLLQLDIGSGTYVGGAEESTFATSDTFTLYGLLNSASGLYGSGGKKVNVNDTFVISVALLYNGLPVTSSVDFGSFEFESTTVSIADMISGNPGISPHGIFDTYYWEYEFTFNASNKAQSYDVESDVGDPVADLLGDLFLASFSVDATNLAAGYSLHFDLYDSNLNQFAPFSHDAQSMEENPLAPPPNPVPEPSTMLLLTLGLIALLALKNKFKAGNLKYAKCRIKSKFDSSS